jgi:hypothetical protein
MVQTILSRYCPFIKAPPVARTTRSGIIVSKSQQQQQQQRSRIRGARTRSTAPAPAQAAGPAGAGVRGSPGEEKAPERGPEAASSIGAKECTAACGVSVVLSEIKK